MAQITATLDGTIKSSTVEAQLIHSLIWLQQIESEYRYYNSTKYKEVLDCIQILFNDNVLTFVANFEIPCDVTIVNGQPIITANNYVERYVFNPGTNGTFKSRNLPAYVIEVITYAQILENSERANPNKKNYVINTFDPNKKVFTGTVTLPYQRHVDDAGVIRIIALEYLNSI